MWKSYPTYVCLRVVSFLSPIYLLNKISWLRFFFFVPYTTLARRKRNYRKSPELMSHLAFVLGNFSCVDRINRVRICYILTTYIYIYNGVYLCMWVCTIGRLFVRKRGFETNTRSTLCSCNKICNNPLPWFPKYPFPGQLHERLFVVFRKSFQVQMYYLQRPAGINKLTRWKYQRIH